MGAAPVDSDEATVVPASALIVTYNDAKHLERCLSNLRELDETIVVDLGSNDGSLEIAQRAGVRVATSPWKPVVEEVSRDVIDLPKNDWILRIDPDEVISASLSHRIATVVSAASHDLAIIDLPNRYHFGGKPLHFSIWGGTKFKPQLFHRERVDLQPYIHQGIALKPGFRRERLLHSDEPIVHFWVDDVPDLIQRHKRYVDREGPSFFAAGKRFSWHRAILASGHAFYRSFIVHRGWRGGPLSWFLSGFYAWYVAASWMALRRYERQVSHNLDRFCG